MTEKIYDIAVVGGGIVGSATFYKLQKQFPEKSLVLIEKENDLARHQTGNNSGVIHSGLYYKPGSMKAKNCVNGRHELVAFAKEHNVAFLPLFYVNEYEGLSNKEVKYDLAFIGTAHSERFESVSNIVKHFDNKFLFFYCPSYMVFLFKKYIKGELQGLHLSDVSFSSMSRDKVLNLIEKTNTIIDISHPSQIGLTMRTIEMLGAGKKIVTTNSQILSYDFYHPSNILYVDDKTSSEEINSFVNTPYSPIESELRRKYSINSWIERLFI